MTPNKDVLSLRARLAVATREKNRLRENLTDLVSAAYDVLEVYGETTGTGQTTPLRNLREAFRNVFKGP